MYLINNTQLYANNFEEETLPTNRKDKVLFTELFEANDIELATNYMQQLQQAIAEETTEDIICNNDILLFLQLNELAKPEYRHLFIIENTNRDSTFIISGYLHFIKNKDNIPDLKDVNEIIDRVDFFVNVGSSCLNDLTTEVIMCFKLIEKNIANGIYIPQPKANDHFTTMFTQGRLLYNLLTNITLKQDIVIYLLTSKYLLTDCSRYKDEVLFYFFGSFSNNGCSLFNYIVSHSHLSSDYKQKAIEGIASIIVDINYTEFFGHIEDIIELFSYLNYNYFNNGTYTRCILIYFQSQQNNLFQQKPHTKTLLSMKFLVSKLQILIKNEDCSSFFTDNYNQLFVDFIFAVMNLPKYYAESVIAEAKKLYNMYLELPQIKALLTATDIADNFGDLEGTVDWNHEDAYNYLIVSNNMVTLLSHQQMLDYTYIKKEESIDSSNLILQLQQKMRANTNINQQQKIINWNNLFLFDLQGNNLSVSSFIISEIFTKYFFIFANAFLSYNSKLMQEQREQFIKILALGKYEANFINAQNSGASEVKLVASVNAINANAGKTDDDFAVHNILKQHIKYAEQEQGIAGITAKHLSQIKDTFQLNNKTADELAVYLVCLACVFTKYSSKSIFGTEYNSPYSLRLYAYALIQQAHKIASSIFIAEEDKLTANAESLSVYPNWKKHLEGENKLADCTDMLSVTMLQYIDKNFNIVYSQAIKTVIPPAWL